MPRDTELPVSPAGKSGWPWTADIPEYPTTMPDSSPWPKVSIVTPSFNQAQFLEETIRSVLLQNYPNLEYIIIDGDSTDGSVDIIKKYEPWLVYWVREADRGQSHAINKGFSHCTGDIVTFQNSDDIYLQGTFDDVASHWLNLQEYGALVGSFYYITETSERADQNTHLPQLPSEGPLDLSLGIPYRLHQVSTFFVANALREVGMNVREDLIYTMDRELLFRVARKYKIMRTERTYGAFRLHDQSKSVSSILPFSSEFSKLHLLFLDGDREKDRLRKRAAKNWIGRGYVKYAKNQSGTVRKIINLSKALWHCPNYAFQTGYLRHWAQLLKNK